MSNNTKLRSTYIRSLAAQVLAASGVTPTEMMTRAEYLDLRGKLAREMMALAKQSGDPVDYLTCKRHINTVLGVAITGVSAETKRGGARPGAGLRRGMKINRKSGPTTAPETDTEG